MVSRPQQNAATAILSMAAFVRFQSMREKISFALPNHKILAILTLVALRECAREAVTLPKAPASRARFHSQDRPDAQRGDGTFIGMRGDQGQQPIALRLPAGF